MTDAVAYAAWIAANCPDPYGRCAEYTAAMVAAFPELTLVRGHYYCPAWGEREHWWCVAACGMIVDPTATQFPSRGPGVFAAQGVYVPWDESQKEPTGLCPNCGGYIYDGGAVCSDECGVAYVAYCSRGW